MAKFTNTVSTVIITALMGTAAIAHAGTPIDVDEDNRRVMYVEYDDITAGNAADMAVLDERIAAAAATVCARSQNDNTLSARSSERTCIARASDTARIAVLAKLESRAEAERLAAR